MYILCGSIYTNFKTRQNKLLRDAHYWWNNKQKPTSNWHKSQDSICLWGGDINWNSHSPLLWGWHWLISYPGKWLHGISSSSCVFMWYVHIVCICYLRVFLSFKVFFKRKIKTYRYFFVGFRWIIAELSWLCGLFTVNLWERSFIKMCEK